MPQYVISQMPGKVILRNFEVLSPHILSLPTIRTSASAMIAKIRRQKMVLLV